MFKKALFALMVMLTLPNLASAYNYWSVSATTSPAAIAGAITAPAAAGYVTSGTTTNVTDAGIASADFTVAATAGNYALAYVVIDGVKATPVAANTYRVAKGSKINHTLSAVYSTQKFTVTTSKTGNGYIDPTSTVAAGATKNVVVKAGIGYKINAVAAGDAVLTAGDGVSSATYTFSNVLANKTVTADFVAVPVVKAKISTSAQTIGSTSQLTIDGSTSTSSVAASYVWSVTPAGATITPAADGKTATLSASAAGTYTVKLTVSAPGATPSESIVVITVAAEGLAASNQCTGCHTARDPQNVAGYTASKHAQTTTSCQSCHTVGNDGMAVQTQANACSACHNTLVVGTGHTVAQANCFVCHNIDSHSLARTPVAGAITENHVGGAVAPGHAQFVSSTVTCANCHAGNNAAILAEYKASGHGNPAGEAWAHYDWRSASRAACQRCHNGTAFVAKLETLGDTTNYFGATPPVAAGETLNCSACHADPATGALRAASSNFTITQSNGATVSYDVAGGSALCVRCHGGRETGESIKLSAGNFANLGFINSHYLSAGGTVYNKTGYEYAGQSYDSLGYHKNIGKDNAFATGSNGPCVACHMSAGAGHTWDFVSKDANGVITANNSALCASCHGTEMTAAKLEEEKEAVHTALEELKVALEGKGIYFYNAHPYFFNANVLTAGAIDPAKAVTANAFKNWDAVYTGLGKDVMGAAFNYNLLEHDPGAYAHNLGYSLKLIADSIDFLDNGAVDNSATSTAKTQLAAANTFVAGTTGTGTNHSPVSTNCAACHTNGLNTTAAEIAAAGVSCGTCHTGRQTSFNGSVHFGASGGSCNFCHSAANHGEAPSCTPCHGQELNDAFHNTASQPVGNQCKDCHSGGNHPHGVKTTAVANLKTKCIECHSVALSHAGDYVKDNNNGVRAITTEFTKYSHHVTGVDLQDAHCAACHLEGKAENGKIVVDPTKHMSDAKTHLRDADTDADFAWDPMAPDHAGMDNFCMSCHDDNGATSPGSVAIQAVIVPAEGKVASATNPFGDTISNKYDKMQRPAVVDVKGQFDLTNPSHHAVMGSRYTGRTTAAGPRQIANPAAFNANSSAWLPGVRKTLYEAGKLNAAYSTLTGINGDQTLGDDSVLHCGDCHTVGQWKAGSSVDINGNPTTAAIGAHGSENAYMLRNTAGTDAAHVGHTLDATGAVNNVGAPWLVCYNCHAFQAYGSPGANAVTHAGEYNVANFRCNSPQFTYTNYTTGTILTTAGVPMNQTRLGYKLGAAGPGSGSAATGGNIYGIQCSNCHNSGPQNGFGGIHGSKVKTYKDGTGAAQKAYRFMPGLGNSMFNPGSMGANNNGTAAKGSVDDKNWEQKALTTANREGCYTLAATSAGNAPARIGAGNLVDGKEVFGTWGACTDHTGTSVQGGTGITRKVIRPTSY